MDAAVDKPLSEGLAALEPAIAPLSPPGPPAVIEGDDFLSLFGTIPPPPTLTDHVGVR
jgi:hypothetical protein